MKEDMRAEELSHITLPRAVQAGRAHRWTCRMPISPAQGFSARAFCNVYLPLMMKKVRCIIKIGLKAAIRSLVMPKAGVIEGDISVIAH